MAERWNGRDDVELRRLHRLLVQRAALERWALRETTEELQSAADGFVRVGTLAVHLARKYWLPVGALAALALFKRQPALRLVRTGLTIWQTARLLRAPRR